MNLKKRAESPYWNFDGKVILEKKIFSSVVFVIYLLSAQASSTVMYKWKNSTEKFKFETLAKIS